MYCYRTLRMWDFVFWNQRNCIYFLFLQSAWWLSYLAEHVVYLAW